MIATQVYIAASFGCALSILNVLFPVVFPVSLAITMSPSGSRVIPFFLHVILGFCTPDTSQKNMAVSGDTTTVSTGGMSMTGATVLNVNDQVSIWT